jgi:hypothetical protein
MIDDVNAERTRRENEEKWRRGGARGRRRGEAGGKRGWLECEKEDLNYKTEKSSLLYHYGHLVIKIFPGGLTHLQFPK